MNRIKARLVHDEAKLYNAEVIRELIYSLVDLECPYCFKPLDLPSLEDIQEWLKEEK